MDVEKTVEFILNQQAQFVVRLDRVEAQVEALAGQTQGLIRVVAEQQNQITTILGILGTLTQQMATLTQRMDTLTQRMDTLTQRVDTLTQRVDTLTQRVDTLAEMFEQWLRRSGDGSRPT